MVPGLFSESPMRNISAPRNGGSHMKNSNSLKMNLIAAEREEYEDLTGVN